MYVVCGRADHAAPVLEREGGESGEGSRHRKREREGSGETDVRDGCQTQTRKNTPPMLPYSPTPLLSYEEEPITTTRRDTRENQFSVRVCVCSFLFLYRDGVITRCTRRFGWSVALRRRDRRMRTSSRDHNTARARLTAPSVPGCLGCLGCVLFLYSYCMRGDAWRRSGGGVASKTLTMAPGKATGVLVGGRLQCS